MSSMLKIATAAGLTLAFLSAPAMAKKAEPASPVVKACSADAKKLCPKAKAKTEDEIKACLEPHIAHVSKKCKKALGDGK